MQILFDRERKTWAFRLRRRAFRYIFARFLPLQNSRTQIPSPLPNPTPALKFPLAKDAAPIPNAFLGDEEWGMGIGNGEWGRGIL